MMEEDFIVQVKKQVEKILNDPAAMNRFNYAVHVVV